MNRPGASHIEGILSAIADPKETERFMAARRVLQEHLVHTREILNGKDFLFAGPSDVLLRALRDLVAIEHRAGRSLQFDFARVDEYFLLRVVGAASYKEVIESYF